MTWVKLDTGFLVHPKLMAASKDAILVYLASICWCADRGTDGAIPRLALVPLASPARPTRVRQVSRELTSLGLWDETPDGWQVHDFLDYQRSTDDTSYLREGNRERQRQFRERVSRNAVTNAVSNPVTNAVSNGEVTGRRREEKEIPPVVPHGGTQQRPPRKSQIPEDFEPDPNQRRWAAEERPGVDLRAEVLKFVDYHRSKGNTFVDHQRAFRTWLRNTRAVPTNGQTPDPFGPPRYRIIGSVPP